jgi:D-glycero-alpha-D-manno-heptose-7-phosphate kinase
MTLIRARAPLRISFAGGGTDVPPFPEREGGCVLNATITRYSYGTLKPRRDHRISIESLDMGVLVKYDPKKSAAYDGNLDLVKAAVKKVKGKDSRGFDLLLHSDAPPGTGLGSSSSLMVTLVGLLKEHENLPLTDYEIASLAFEIERRELGIQGGYQDQYAATFGGFNFMEFLKDRVIVNPLKVRRDIINELEHNLLLCYTGGTRLSANIIRDQVGRYENGQADALDGLRELKRIAVEMKNALLQGRLNEFGSLMNYAWENKQKLSRKIVTPHIEEMYHSARKAGAIGGKLSGAGGGGFMMFYCPFERKHKVAAALRERSGIIHDFSFDLHGLQTWRVNE